MRSLAAPPLPFRSREQTPSTHSARSVAEVGGVAAAPVDGGQRCGDPRTGAETLLRQFVRSRHYSSWCSLRESRTVSAGRAVDGWGREIE